MRTSLVAILGLAVALTACGGGDGGSSGSTTTISCLFTDDTCSELTATMTSSQRTSLGSDCTSAGGAFTVGACPTAGAVAGYCSYTGSQFTAYTGLSLSNGSLREYFYSAGGWTEQDAQSWCSTPPAGTWVP
jgi:hypothetical protein